MGIIGKANGPSRGVISGVPVVSGVWNTSRPPADLICIWRLGLTWPLMLTRWCASVQWISAGACSCSDRLWWYGLGWICNKLLLQICRCSQYVTSALYQSVLACVTSSFDVWMTFSALSNRVLVAKL